MIKLRHARGRAKEIKRILRSQKERCLNPACQKPLKYSGNKNYCSRACEREYTPTMVYFSRLYGAPFREVLVRILNECTTIRKTATEMDVRPMTIHLWTTKLDVKKVSGTWE